MLAEAEGDVDRAFAVLLDARARTNRLADPYVWLDVHILDALCELGRRHGHPLTATWAATMLDRASRTGMRELTVRAMLHEAASGIRGDAEAAAMLAGRHRQPGADRAPRGGWRHLTRVTAVVAPRRRRPAGRTARACGAGSSPGRA